MAELDTTVVDHITSLLTSLLSDHTEFINATWEIPLASTEAARNAWIHTASAWAKMVEQDRSTILDYCAKIKADPDFH